MNSDRDFETTTAEWLNAGTDTTPPHLIDAVLLAAGSTPQERYLRSPLRARSLTFFMRVAAVIVVVAVAGVAALYAFGAGPNIGFGPSADPTSIPSDTEPVFDVALHYYTMDGDPVRDPEPTRIHARLPDGWVADESGMRMDSDEAERSVAISFWAVDAVFTEPCNGDGRADPPGMETIDGLANTFRSRWFGDGPLGQPTTTEPVPTTVSGFRARYLEVRIPDDFDPDECLGGRYATWRNADGVERHQRPGDVSRIWIVEVGPTYDPPPYYPTTPLLVIDATSQGEPAQEGLTGLADIIESLRIESGEEATADDGSAASEPSASVAASQALVQEIYFPTYQGAFDGLGLTEGTLVEDNGCLWIDEDSGYRWLVLWPEAAQLGSVGDRLAVTDGSNQVVVGERISAPGAGYSPRRGVRRSSA